MEDQVVVEPTLAFERAVQVRVAKGLTEAKAPMKRIQTVVPVVVAVLGLSEEMEPDLLVELVVQVGHQT
jgi:hypothetical protein